MISDLQKRPDPEGRAFFSGVAREEARPSGPPLKRSFVNCRLFALVATSSRLRIGRDRVAAAVAIDLDDLLRPRFLRPVERRGARGTVVLCRGVGEVERHLGAFVGEEQLVM